MEDAARDTKPQPIKAREEDGLAGVLLAVSIPFLACAVQWIFWDAIQPYVWFLFFPAVFVSSRIGGVAGGLLATVTSIVLVIFFFIPPQCSFMVENSKPLYSVVLFAIMGALFTLTHERLRKAREKAAQALRETRQANERLTGANEKIERLYRKTLELDEIKNQFFANVSHELRTPLTLILGPLGALIEKGGFAEDARRDLAVADRNARLLLRHVTDLLDISKLEAGRMEMRYSEIDLAGLVRLAASHFEVLAGEKRIAFAVEAPDGLRGQVDVEKTQRVLLNLLSNAFKFTPEGGAIALTLSAASGQASVRVQDNGPGVPAGLREAIFERFRQVEGGAERSHGGTGLGLAIVKEFVGLHQGRVEALESPGGGALFEVTLPLEAPRGAPIFPAGPGLDAEIEREAVEELLGARGVPETQAVSAGADAPLVLVVEDHPDMNAYLARALGQRFQVATAFDGREGLEKALERRPALILVDLMMPVMGGEQLVKALRSRPETQATPVLVLTAKADDALRVKLLRDGVQDYLCKPFSDAELLARMERLVAERGRTQHLVQQSEEHYRSLFANMMNGFAYCRMIFDEQGNPCDFVYLDVNAAFELQTGLSNVIGRKVSEVIPGIRESGQSLFDIYGRVALTGAPERTEIYLAALEMWFSIAVYSPEKGYFVAIFDVVTDRKRVEKALREEDYYLAKSQALTHVGHWSMDLATREITISDEMLRILQLERGEADFDVLSGMIHPDDHAMSMAHVREALETGKGYEVEHRLLLRDGAEKWVHAIGEAKLDSAGKVERLYVTTQDITGQKHAAEVLRESEERYRNLVEQSPEAICIHAGGVFVFANPAGLRLLGAATPHDLLGTPILERIHPDFRNLVSQRISLILDQGESTGMAEEKLLRLDGGVVDAEVVSTPFFYHGWPAVQIIARDISKRKRAEEALQAREEEFRKLSQEFRGLLDAIPDNITLQDRDLNILWANKNSAMGENGGVEGLIGQHCYTVWHGLTAPCESCPVVESFSTGKPAHVAVKSQDGRTWDLRAVPLLDELGKVTNIIEVARDITELRMLEAHLSQAQKMESVGRLAGGVAHDFNNMLGVILGHTEMALQEVDVSQPIHADLKEIEAAAQRSADLTRQLLAFARKQTVSPRVLDFNASIEGLLKMLRRLIGEEIQLQWKPGSDLCPIKMDSSQLDQILTNLCVNARDAIGGPGQIAIETGNASFDESYCAAHANFVPGDFVWLSVSDDGGGMDQETLTHLFEPFFTTKDLGRGTGLGLATVYGVIQQNHGFIQVDSQVGQGTSFKIYLPRHVDKAVRAPETRSNAAIARGRETVLLVEDEPALLKLGAAVLKQLGYQTIAAATPGEAIRLAEEHRGEIHLLITDVIMPEMNGRELAKRVQSLYPGVKRLFMSGYTADIVAHQGVLEEGIHFIQKPFSMSALSAKIREVLGHE